jgi:hypothetical protein
MVCSFLLASNFAFGALVIQAAPLNTPVHPAVQPTQSLETKSYREWKMMRIQESESRVKILKDNFLKTKTAASAQTSTEAGLNSDLRQMAVMLDKEELQLSLTKDLTISDYFVGYLTKQKSLPMAIKEVSGRLSSDEVAELMTAYANNFFSSRQTSTPVAPRADSEY